MISENTDIFVGNTTLQVAGSRYQANMSNCLAKLTIALPIMTRCRLFS